MSEIGDIAAYHSDSTLSCREQAEGILCIFRDHRTFVIAWDYKYNAVC